MPVAHGTPYGVVEDRGGTRCHARTWRGLRCVNRGTWDGFCGAHARVVPPPVRSAAPGAALLYTAESIAPPPAAAEPPLIEPRRLRRGVVPVGVLQTLAAEFDAISEDVGEGRYPAQTFTDWVADAIKLG